MGLLLSQLRNHTGKWAQHLAQGPPAEAVTVEQKDQICLGEEIAQRPESAEGPQQLLLGGDVILDVLGVGIDGPDAFAKILDAVEKLGPEDSIRITILRGGKQQVLSGKVKDLIDVRD